MPVDGEGASVIARALWEVYGDQAPMEFQSIVTRAMGGPDPLDCVDVHASAAFGVPHWHYVSYGFTELHTKESHLSAVSGWGFELTLRLAQGPERKPPLWPVKLMQNLARYVYDTGRLFQLGGQFDANGPLAKKESTAITGVVFTADPELPRSASQPNGSFGFLQMVGVTADELEASHAWSTPALLDLLGPAAGNVTDLRRTSVLAGKKARAALDAGVLRDGSATERLRLDALGVRFDEEETLFLTFAARNIRIFARVLTGRLRHGRPLRLVCNTTLLDVETADRVELVDGALRLPPAVVEVLAGLQPVVGLYPITPGLVVELIDH